jgi:hypothetical protein
MVVKAYLQSECKVFETSRCNVRLTIERNIQDHKIDDARKNLPTLCSAYESELAYKHLLNCVEIVRSNMALVLESREIPVSVIAEVAAICYAKDLVKSSDLKSFVVDFLGKKRKREEIEALAHSDHVADCLVHLVQRGAFQYEELVTFARRLQADLKIDLSWFLEAETEIDPDAVQSVTIMGRVWPLPASAPRIDAIGVTLADDKLPDLPLMFKSEDYNQMTQYVDDVLSKLGM